MSDSDVELEFLSLDEDVQVFGEHELKTTPLATREAVDVQEDELAQRGLLGKVLSVHGEDFPLKLGDPRIYMNLDAPSSGLVCGVQGSGKSHTVSCIMESALIVDRRIGTLPAPLSTVVFHYDEENGGRPCEAAFLSELKGGDRGVKEVIVLVSPSNLRTRSKVYSGLKHVQVKALRIAEEDLNASRMLSMMGADNLETVPLYLHTALSILREMGSDAFNYRDFRKQLQEQEFNKSQSAMLQLRLDLLNSFLQGDGSDLTSFFKPGRLIVVDLSDPFVDGITAAMLFDICLGLFIEWKTATGKLIVLDEAHKYLTNADANRFTKSICSIIRQQRHLAARVIVSTQEPTVVPSSVLDLMAWIICHRFSSPSWVKHLAHHVCVEQEMKDADSNVEWGKRVMTLKTGQALLFSPASLFVSNKGTLATLSTGYAIIKSRPRLTEDGGGSLLATTGKCAEDVSEKILVAPITPHSSRPTSPSDNSNAKASPDFNQTAFSPPRSLDTHTGMAASVDDLPQQSFSSRLSLSGTSLPRSSARTSDADPIVTQAPLPVVTPPAEFSLLIQVLEEMELETGVSFQPNLDVRQRIVTKNPDAICQGENKNWRTYLKFAKSYQIVEVMDSGSHKKIALTPRYRAMPRSSGHLDCQHVPSTSSSDQSHSSSANVPEQFRGLVSVMAALSSNGTPGLTQTAIGAKLLKDLSTHYRVYGYRKLKDFLKAASDAGLVEVVSSVIGGESTWKLTTP